MSAPGVCGTCGGPTSDRRHATCRRCILAAAKGREPGVCEQCGGPTDPRSRRHGRCQGADLDEFMWLVEGGVWPPSAARRVGVGMSAIARTAYRKGRSDVLAVVYRTREALVS